jgi:hypothetical protein
MHLHTYHPIEVDEDVLTDHECREALVEFFRNEAAGTPEPDLCPYLTPAELRRHRTSHQATQQVSVDVSDGDGLLHVARLRKFACRKYNGGEQIWCGDGPPPWRQKSL